MWLFKKKKKELSLPEFKIEISICSISNPKYILRKLNPLDTYGFHPYEMVDIFDSYDKAISAIELCAEFPQYFNKQGERVK